MKKAIITTKIILMVVTTGIIMYDISVAARGFWDATISHQVTTISSHFPFIAIAWGCLSFHFFGSKLGKKLFGKIPRLRYVIWISLAVFLLVLCVINLFNPIAFIEFLGNNLLLSLLIGQVVGLFWYNNKVGGNNA